MPIRIVDKASRLAKLNATLSGVDSVLQGTNTAPAARTGVLSAAAFVGAILAAQGVFTAAPNRTAILGASMAGFTAALQGTAFSSISSGAPYIYALDTTGGPKLGGRLGRGAYLNVYLYNAGNYSEWGVTSFVTIGGVRVHGYCALDPVRSPHQASLGLKRLVCQIGSDLVQALTNGVEYMVAVSVNGEAPSNPMDSGFYVTQTGKNISYRVNSDRIIFVDTLLGNNSTGDGSFDAPYQDLQTTAGTGGALRWNNSASSTNGTQPGTHVYLRGRVSSRDGPNTRCIDLGRITGLVGRPIVIKSYPGEVGANNPELFEYRSNSGSGGFINGQWTALSEEARTAFAPGTGWNESIEVSDIKVTIHAGSGSDHGPFNLQYHMQRPRISNCEGSWPSTVTGSNHGRSGGIEGSPVDGFFGVNYFHDIYGDTAEENHAIYLDGFSSQVLSESAACRNEICGNTIDNITHGCGIQQYGGSANHAMADNLIYDNKVTRISKHALNFNQLCQRSKAWNNILAHINNHAVLFDTTVLTAGNAIYIANCVVYDWGRTIPDRRAFWKNSQWGGIVRVENCIVALPATHANNGVNWLADNAGGVGTFQFVKCRWDDRRTSGGLTSKPPEDATGTFGNPGFTDAANDDFSLLEGSACINAGNVPQGISRTRGIGGNAAPQGGAHDQGAYER